MDGNELENVPLDDEKDGDDETPQGLAESTADNNSCHCHNNTILRVKTTPKNFQSPKKLVQSEPDFKKPEKQKQWRRCRVVINEEQGDTITQTSSETEEDATKGMKKRKFSSPEQLVVKKALWEEILNEKEKQANAPCECGGTTEKHQFLISQHSVNSRN
ncbi:hypothetical protein JTB14_032915 [Gonioctena quinquepunctata]|nr:hypothetical protein JTB14_032915 [Gonioctena quinquepunctata]